MNAADRRDRAARLCRELNRRISEVASPGLGHWDPAWTFVEEPSDRFLDRLDGWIASGDDTDRAALEAATHEVLEAWRQADAQYRAAGCPGAPDRAEVLA